MAKTLYEKVWQAHIVDQIGDDSLIYIDRHLIHEVTSPQAFAGLEEKGRKVRRPDRTFATMDTNAEDGVEVLLASDGGAEGKDFAHRRATWGIAVDGHEFSGKVAGQDQSSTAAESWAAFQLFLAI